MSAVWNYLPIFKTTVRLTSEMSDADFGAVIRAALSDLPEDKRPDSFSDTQYMIYKMIMDDAKRVYSGIEAKISARERRRETKRSAKNQTKPKDPHDIDPEEAFRLALERSFGKDPDSGAGT